MRTRALIYPGPRGRKLPNATWTDADRKNLKQTKVAGRKIKYCRRVRLFVCLNKRPLMSYNVSRLIVVVRRRSRGFTLRSVGSRTRTRARARTQIRLGERRTRRRRRARIVREESGVPKDQIFTQRNRVFFFSSLLSFHAIYYIYYRVLRTAKVYVYALWDHLRTAALSIAATLSQPSRWQLSARVEFIILYFYARTRHRSQ